MRIFATNDAIKTFFYALASKSRCQPCLHPTKMAVCQHNGDTVSCWYGDCGISNMFTSFATTGLRELTDGWLTLASQPGRGILSLSYPQAQLRIVGIFQKIQYALPNCRTMINDAHMFHCFSMSMQSMDYIPNRLLCCVSE